MFKQLEKYNFASDDPFKSLFYFSDISLEKKDHSDLVFFIIIIFLIFWIVLIVFNCYISCFSCLTNLCLFFFIYAILDETSEIKLILESNWDFRSAF